MHESMGTQVSKLQHSQQGPAVPMCVAAEMWLEGAAFARRLKITQSS